MQNFLLPSSFISARRRTLLQKSPMPPAATQPSAQVAHGVSEHQTTSNPEVSRDSARTARAAKRAAKEQAELTEANIISS